VSLRSKLSRLEATALRIAPPPVQAWAEAARVAGTSGGRVALLDDLRTRIQATLERTARRAPLPVPRVDDFELPFAVEQTERGALHVRTLRLSHAHRTGRASIAPARRARSDMLALLALDPGLSTCDPAGALYLDTETTGLAGGAGTVAFLVGLAFWHEGSLVLEQLLVRALGEEAPMLARVKERLEHASMLVTFNGKSFDMPLLRTRFVMARMEAPPSPPHLDLLHVARRVHGKTLDQGCRLVALERQVLGFERIDDIEGGDVAACYLHFLRTGDGRSLMGVVEHNAWDVVAMAALVGMYGEPLEGVLPAGDLVGVARTLRRAGALDRAGELAEEAVLRASSPASLRARADIAKARGDRVRALADFETLAATVDDASVRLELAKLYEHWKREPAQALSWVERGTGEDDAKTRRRAERLARKASHLP
jgi:uncharacterized protein YprB with RNaseH-like and TPR domain